MRRALIRAAVIVSTGLSGSVHVVVMAVTMMSIGAVATVTRKLLRQFGYFRASMMRRAIAEITSRQGRVQRRYIGELDTFCLSLTARHTNGGCGAHRMS